MDIILWRHIIQYLGKTSFDPRKGNSLVLITKDLLGLGTETESRLKTYIFILI